MWDFDLMAAVRAIEKSMAYVIYRMLICLGAALGYVLATLAGAGTVVGFGSLTRNPSALGPFGAAIGFVLFAYLMYKIRPIWLSAINVPQLALLSDQQKGITLPSGKALIDYAKQREKFCFPSTSGLFQLDSAIRQTQGDIADLHPCSKFPTGQNVFHGYLNQVVRWFSGLNHQTLLAWHFYSGSDNPWTSAVAGLAVNENHSAGMLKNRLAVTLISWLGFIAAYPLMLAGIRILVEGIPINLSFWPHVFAGVFAWSIKAAFFDAIAEAAMMQYFFPLAEREAEHSNSEPLQKSSATYRQMMANSQPALTNNPSSSESSEA